MRAQSQHGDLYQNRIFEKQHPGSVHIPSKASCRCVGSTFTHSTEIQNLDVVCSWMLAVGLTIGRWEPFLALGWYLAELLACLELGGQPHVKLQQPCWLSFLFVGGQLRRTSMFLGFPLWMSSPLSGVPVTQERRFWVGYLYVLEIFLHNVYFPCSRT